MKNTYLLAVIALAGVAFVSCQTDELSENVRETIYTRNNGADIPAHIYGNTASKTFLVIVHGGPAGSGIEYRGYYSQQLEKDYAVVYTDQRGQGMSHGKYDVENVTINQLAEDLYALSLGLKQRYGQDISLFMMGHSWGGTLGTAYMLIDSFRNQYNGWLECDGAHDIPLLNRSAIAMYKQIGSGEIAKGNNVSEWEPLVEFANSVDTNNITVDESGTINQNAYTAEGLIADVTVPEIAMNGPLSPYYLNHQLNSRFSGGITASQLDAEIEAFSATDQLSKIDIPTLLLWGKYDFVCPPRLATSAMKHLGAEFKELVVFEKSGHSPMDNEPEAFISVVKDFIEQWK